MNALAHAAVAMLAMLLCAPALLALDDVAPPQPPQPRVIPSMPMPSSTTAMTVDQRLLHDLERRVILIDRELGAQVRAGGLPAAALSDDARLVAPRQERERAARALRAAIDEINARQQRSHDVLDGSEPRRQAVEHGALSASNVLAVCECLRQLIAAAPVDGSADQRIATDLAEAQTQLTQIERTRLSPSELATSDFLTLWFHCEHARLAARRNDADAAQRLAAATALRDRFVVTYRDSDMALLAQSLLTGISASAATLR